MTTKKRAATIELIDIPPEYGGAIDTAWKRAKQLSYGMPLFMLEAMKPMIVSIYMQGLVDGYGVRDREFEASATEKEELSDENTHSTDEAAAAIDEEDD